MGNPPTEMVYSAFVKTCYFDFDEEFDEVAKLRVE